jgi:hypothetical protein
MHDPFAPLTAIASPFGAASAAVVAAGCQPTLMLFSSAAPWPLSCDASCKKVPPDASQDLDPPTQPVEKEALKTSRMTTPHIRNRCVTRPPAPGPCRETHPAEKAPKMRLPISSLHRNPLKHMGLEPHE